MFKYRGVCSRDLRGSYIIKSIFCAAVLIFFVSNSNAQNEHPIKIGWIKEGLSPQEVKGAANYLAKQKEFNFIPISLKQLTSEFVKKNHLTHIWWLKDDQEIKANEKTAGPVLKQFVQSGGNLVLSMEAVRLLNEWGIEKNKFEIKEDSVIDEGFGRPCGFHSYQSHPIYQGLHGGAYTWKGKADNLTRKIGFFENHIPDTTIAKVIGIGWTYITFHEDEKLVMEYHLGKGTIMAVGAYSYFSKENFNSNELYRFYNNIFNYTAHKISTVKPGYWSFSKPLVSQLKKKLKSISIATATKWNPPALTLEMKRQEATNNFFDVTGRRMLVMGKERGGIDEIWSHPFMSFRDIQTGIQMRGEDTITWLRRLIPTITVSPEMVIRKYALGNDTLQEIITADFNKPVAVLHYEWTANTIKKIWIKYTSNLRLMWPYSDTSSPVINYQWSPEMNAAIVSNPNANLVSLMSFSNRPDDHVMGQYKDFHMSQGTIRGNQTSLQQVSGIFSFAAAALKGKFNAYMVAGSEGADNSISLFRKIIPALNNQYQVSATYYKNLLKKELMITTPDKEFNEGYRWAVVRTDQFLQTTPGVGTSMMAGFGTTARGWNGRQSVSGRPGYAWYFGRDGAWGAMALDGLGGFDQVKKVLDLFVKFQAVNGKIFHELTSSGVVHYDAADATPLFVILAYHYLQYSGDFAYIKSIWPAIKKAMDFCYSTDTDKDGLIENTNVGHGWVEGGPLFGSHTEFYLAGSWAAALDGAGYIARYLHLTSLENKYKKDAQNVKDIINRDFWSAKENHFYNGKMQDGTYMPDATVLAAVPIYFNAVTDKEKAWKTTSSFSGDNFSTDWGMRIMPATNPKFDPGAYHAGMVWPLFSGYASLAEYKTGSYVSGFTHMMNNLLEYRLWSLGSVEETLNGEICKPAGVCSQQGWSETMVIQPAVEGMLGLHPDALSHNITLSPCFPWNWGKVSVDYMHVGNVLVNMTMSRHAGTYNYDFEKTGPSLLTLHFCPMLPPGAQVSKVMVNGKEILFTQVETQEAVKVILSQITLTQHVKVSIRYQGGIGVLPLVNELHSGAHNTGAKITGQNWQKNKYNIQVEGIPAKTYELNVYSSKPIQNIKNGTFVKLSPELYRIIITIPCGNDPYGSQETIIYL